jgi:ABC-type branched-subunit amino acid transport system substrate-binding protein
MRGRRSMAVLVSLGVAAGALAMTLPGSAGASAPAQPFPKVDQPGVTDTEIDVGGVASKTNNPVGTTFADSFAGVQAYFDMINNSKDKGIYGRKLKLVAQRDDQLGSNQSEVQGLISQDNVFAALPMTQVLFTGAPLLEQSGIPTFGWDINPEWGSETHPGAPNMFGEKRSYLCFTCASQGLPWLAKQIHAKRIAVLAYTVVQSADCLKGIEASFQKYPSAKIVFTDSSLQFGNTDYSNDVAQMIDKKVDLVTTCIDNNGVLNLAREMKQQGLNAPQYLPQAYDQKFMQANGQFFEGSYVLTFFTPFEVKQKPPGLKQYLRQMDKTGGPKNEHSLSGWINADLFVTGLKAAGPDFTRQKVIDSINKITDYTAGGILGGIDWTRQHTADPQVDCTVLSKIHNSKFVPSFGQPDKPFVCYMADAPKLPARILNR